MVMRDRYFHYHMIITTTQNIEGRPVEKYLSPVASEVIYGANIVRDFAANVVDMTGGRSATQEKVFEESRKTALKSIEGQARDLGADAVLSLRFEYLVLGEKNGMMMVCAYGTPVILGKTAEQIEADKKFAEENEACFSVAVGGVMRGPFSKAQISELLQAGRITPDAAIQGPRGVGKVSGIIG